jgi:hypothetical protein
MKNTFSSCDVTLSKPSLSCGTSGTGETPKAQRGRGLTGRPEESETPGTEINNNSLEKESLQKQPYIFTRLFALLTEKLSL